MTHEILGRVRKFVAEMAVEFFFCVSEASHTQNTCACDKLTFLLARFIYFNLNRVFSRSLKALKNRYFPVVCCGNFV